MPNFDFDEGFSTREVKSVKILGPLHVSLKAQNRNAIDISGSNCDFDVTDRVLTIKPTASTPRQGHIAHDQILEAMELQIPPTLRLNAPRGMQVELVMKLEGEVMTFIP